MPDPIIRPAFKAPANVVSSLERKLEDDLKKRLNLAALPQELMVSIKETASEVAGTITKQNITKKALVYGKEIFREVDHAKAISDRLAGALKGVQLVTQSTDLQKIMDENAKMLFAKKKALVTAGFTDNEAFQLILVEVSAKKSK